MKIFTTIIEAWADILNFWGKAWWVEISTDQPQCTYYFGPFTDINSAAAEVRVYIEDLEAESAQGILAQVKCCKPAKLTIEHQ